MSMFWVGVVVGVLATLVVLFIVAVAVLWKMPSGPWR